MNYFLRYRDFHVNKLERLFTSKCCVVYKCYYIMDVRFYWGIRDTQSSKYHLNEIHYFHGKIIKK